MAGRALFVVAAFGAAALMAVPPAAAESCIDVPFVSVDVCDHNDDGTPDAVYAATFAAYVMYRHYERSNETGTEHVARGDIEFQTGPVSELDFRFVCFVPHGDAACSSWSLRAGPTSTYGAGTTICSAHAAIGCWSPGDPGGVPVPGNVQEWVDWLLGSVPDPNELPEDPTDLLPYCTPTVSGMRICPPV